MSQKLKWVEAGGVRHQVVDFSPPKDSEHVPAGREDGETGDALIDLSQIMPFMQAADGESLVRTKMNGEGAKWAVVKLACGAHPGESCGCGCNHGHKAVALSPERAVAWAMSRGAGRADLPRDLQFVFDAMEI